MVGTQARRHMVAEILYYANDYIKMKTLAERLGVSYSTIRNDVDILSLTYNIISKAGFDGGVLLRVQRKKLRFLDADETASLLRIMRIVPESERVYITSIIRDAHYGACGGCDRQVDRKTSLPAKCLIGFGVCTCPAEI